MDKPSVTGLRGNKKRASSGGAVSASTRSLIAPKSRRMVRALALIGRAAPAALLVLAAVTNIIPISSNHPSLVTLFLDHGLDLDQLATGRPGTVIIALVLLPVVRAMLRGKRHAWLLAVTLCAFSLASTRLSHDDSSYTPMAFGLLLALLLLAPLFPARSDLRSLLRGYVVLAMSLACLIGHGLVKLLQNQTILVAGQQLHFEPGPLRSATMTTLQVLAFLFLGYGVLEVLRPVLRARRMHRAEVARARKIVEQYATRSMAHFTLLGTDKSYFWSSTGASFLAYRLSFGVALVLGDPIGPQEELEPLLLAFSAYCRLQDWKFAMYQASPWMLQVGRNFNLSAYKVGEEAIVPAAYFTTKGKAGAPVRHSIARARRDGVTVRCLWGEPLPDDLVAGMKRITSAWMAMHNSRTQMGFSMGQFPADWSPQLLTAVALDRKGEVQAFITWTPLYAGGGWSLDNMRRLPGATPGIMEMLISSSIDWARERGYVTMSLGLAPLVGLDNSLEVDLRDAATAELAVTKSETSGPPSWLERSVAFLYKHRILLGNYASLQFFKSKFNPIWESRYLIVRDTSALPIILAALAQAHGYTWQAVLRESGLVGLLSQLRRVKAGARTVRPSEHRPDGSLEQTSKEDEQVEWPLLS
jgi:phosphatidylglycerol lysyltransferase